MESWQWIVLFGAAIVVLSRLLAKKETPPPQEDLLSEVEETLGRFADEMAADNEELLGHIASLRSLQDRRVHALEQKVEALERKLMAPSRNNVESNTESNAALSSPQAANEMKPNAAGTPVPHAAPAALTIKQRYSDLFALHDQGKSMEYISKKTGMNKGEIQLIMKLAKQEEETVG